MRRAKERERDSVGREEKVTEERFVIAYHSALYSPNQIALAAVLVVHMARASGDGIKF